MTTADLIQIRLADGSVLSLARDEARDLADRLNDAASLDGALSLAVQISEQLKQAIGLGRGPIDLLRREERALRSVLGTSG